jgi:ADP-ribosylglycohydrolase
LRSTAKGRQVLVDTAVSTAGGHASDHRKVIASLGEGGWCGEEALAIGLYSALTDGSFTQVLSIAANHDGDSDSTASIAAQLYGASEGLTGLIRHVDVLEILLVRRNFL